MLAGTNFNPIPERFCFPKQEEKILQYWQQNQCFKKQQERTANMPKFTFYDGPPFATGEPHYGHICAGTIQDVVCRYASQTGHYVQRRFGWDCHGLPVEYEIDKAEQIKDKQKILEMGIGNYNNKCRAIVMKYSSQWEAVVNRFGRWIDFRNDYKTMDKQYMESVWYVFKSLFNKGLVYRGMKIMPYSNAVHTVLSNFEVQQNYKKTKDPSLWVTFPLADNPEVSFLVWTTTPWTLPSNLALAVNPQFTYVEVKDLKRNRNFILAECRLDSFYPQKKKKKKDAQEQEKHYVIVRKMKGADLVSVSYTPMFEYFGDQIKNGCFRVYAGGFVTDDAGTGVVHCAPGFGDEDYKMCVKEKLIRPDTPPVPLDENGRFTKQIEKYEGLYFKDADPIIIEDLKQKGRVIKHEQQQHNYPFCWRSDTPLIYKAVTSWFIKVTDIKKDLIENNKKSEWVPKNIQEKRFSNWLKDSQDWCFSRSRFWGNPIPLWVSDDGEQVVCVGSVQELEQLTGQKVTDLHRQFIDHLKIPSKQGKGYLRRIEQVFDCWFESGSMPFAQAHYPFEVSQQEFSKRFPANFIAEGIDQTRGWFYTLNVIATGMKNMNPFQNVIVNGLVLNHQGKKMSKRLKNYPPPQDVCNQFGADAVRLYLINSPLVKAQNLNFSEEGVKDVVKNILLPWYNAYRFLIQNIMKYESKSNCTFVFGGLDELRAKQKLDVTDLWIESTLQKLIREVRKEMEAYKLYNVVPPLVKFLQNLTNWYVRLNRPRLKGESGSQQMLMGLNILYDVLFKVNILLSPIVPFLTDHMYQNMKKCLSEDNPQFQDSIHHLPIPEPNEMLVDQKMEKLMEMAMEVIEATRKMRDQNKVSIKTPLAEMTLINESEETLENLKSFLKYFKEQLNVDEIKFCHEADKFIKLTCMPYREVLGPKYGKNFGNLIKAIDSMTTDQIRETRKQGKIELLGHQILLQQLVIRQDFIKDNVRDHEVIGGKQCKVLLNTKLTEELLTRGAARQLISRVQKLKKKAHLNAQDEVFIFYNFQETSHYLKKAMEVDMKTILNAIKKPMLPFELFNHLIIETDHGKVNGEVYDLYITHPHLLLLKNQMKSQFAQKATMLQNILLSQPYSKAKQHKLFRIKLDGKQYILEEGKHYKIVAQ